MELGEVVVSNLSNDKDRALSVVVESGDSHPDQIQARISLIFPENKPRVRGVSKLKLEKAFSYFLLGNELIKETLKQNYLQGGEGELMFKMRLA